MKEMKMLKTNDQQFAVEKELKATLKSIRNAKYKEIHSSLEKAFGYPVDKWPAGTFTLKELDFLDPNWVQNLQQYLQEEGFLEEFLTEISGGGWECFAYHGGALAFVEGEKVSIRHIRNNIFDMLCHDLSKIARSVGIEWRE